MDYGSWEHELDFVSGDEATDFTAVNFVQDDFTNKLRKFNLLMSFSAWVIL